MVSEIKNDVYLYTDENVRNVINTLNNEKLQLLKDQKSLCLQLQEKDVMLNKITEKYKMKWESVCDHLRQIMQMCNDLNIGDKQVERLQHESLRLINGDQCLDNIYSAMDCSITNSSFYTAATDTTESTFSTSTESLIAGNMDTLKKEKFSSNTEFLSTNSLTNCIRKANFDQSANNLLAKTNHLSPERPHSQCMDDSTGSLNKAEKIDAAISEPDFRIPDMSTVRSKKLLKKSSTLRKKSDTNSSTPNVTSNQRSISDYSDDEVLCWLSDIVRLPKSLLENIRTKNKITGPVLSQLTEQKFDKVFGVSDKLIRKKVMVLLEELRSSDDCENISEYDICHKDHLWVANIWLKKHLGLSHLSSAFLSRCIDGKMLKIIATTPHSRQKEFISLSVTNFDRSSGFAASPLLPDNRNSTEPTKSELRSIRYGLQLLMKFNFDLGDLEKRRTSCDNSNFDLLVWTNERVAKWFHQLNLKQYIRGIEYSGVHGGIMVLDSQFCMNSMWKLLQIPTEIIRKHNLDDKFTTLLKPCRFNEGVKERRSGTIFRRRSFSQPRLPKHSLSRNSNTKNSGSDLTESTSKTETNSSSSVSKQIHREKSQTLDLSFTNTNKNFVRTYRKPENRYPTPELPNDSSDLFDQNAASYGRLNSDNTSLSHASDSSLNFNFTPGVKRYVKSPTSKISSHNFYLTKKSVPRSESESENDEEL